MNKHMILWAAALSTLAAVAAPATGPPVPNIWAAPPQEAWKSALLKQPVRAFCVDLLRRTSYSRFHSRPPGFVLKSTFLGAKSAFDPVPKHFKPRGDIPPGLRHTAAEAHNAIPHKAMRINSFPVCGLIIALSSVTSLFGAAPPAY